MTEHIYPAFGRGRIMKKELLWALRDYSYTAMQNQYQDYADGIISGCRIFSEENHLRIASGMIKCADYIFLIKGSDQIPYKPTEEYISLKFYLKDKEELPDYTRYLTNFKLDIHLERSNNEIELCRFKLKEGARLRADYKDFYDIQTEYDTINLANATWSSIGQNTLSKEVTDCFARKVLECKNAAETDLQFAYFLLQGREAVNYSILTDYISRKTKEEITEHTLSKENAFYKLEQILDGIRKGTGVQRENRTGADHRMIVWD